MWSPAQYPGPLESGNFCIRHVLFGGNPCRPSTTLKVMRSIGSLRWLRPDRLRRSVDDGGAAMIIRRGLPLDRRRALNILMSRYLNITSYEARDEDLPDP